MGTWKADSWFPLQVNGHDDEDDYDYDDDNDDDDEDDDVLADDEGYLLNI